MKTRTTLIDQKSPDNKDTTKLPLCAESQWNHYIYRRAWDDQTMDGLPVSWDFWSFIGFDAVEPTDYVVQEIAGDSIIFQLGAD